MTPTEQIFDLGYSEALWAYVAWLAIGIVLSVIAWQLCVNPRARRAHFGARAYPRLGRICAVTICATFATIGAPMFFSRFHTLTLGPEKIVLHYALGHPIAFPADTLASSGLRRYAASKTLWQGTYVSLATHDGARYHSVVSKRSRARWPDLEHELAAFRPTKTPQPKAGY